METKQLGMTADDYLVPSDDPSAIRQIEFNPSQPKLVVVTLPAEICGAECLVTDRSSEVWLRDVDDDGTLVLEFTGPPLKGLDAGQARVRLAS